MCVFLYFDDNNHDVILYEMYVTVGVAVTISQVPVQRRADVIRRLRPLIGEFVTSATSQWISLSN